MPQPSVDTLGLLVDGLCRPGSGEAPAYLIQKNPSDATVVLREAGATVVLLVGDSEQPLEPRLRSALASESSDVTEGLRARPLFVAMLPGTAAPAVDTDLILPEQHGILKLDPASGRVTILDEGPRPHAARQSRQTACSTLEAAWARALLPPAGIPLDQVEREGESALKSEGIFMRRWAVPTGTRLVLCVCLIMYALQVLWGGFTRVGALRFGAIQGRLVTQGELWRLLTAAYLHTSLWHLANNMVALMIVGRVFEAALGTARFLIVYTALALGASACTAAMRPDQVVLGASGAIVGLFGAVVALGWVDSTRLPPITRRRVGTAALSWVVLSLAVGLLPSVSFVGHAAGATLGLLLIVSRAPMAGLGAIGSEPDEGPFARRTARAAALVALTITVAALGMDMLRGRPWELVRVPELRPLSLGESGLSGRFPAPLLERVTTSRQEKSLRHVIGDPDRNELVIAIVERDQPLDDTDEDAAAELLDTSLLQDRERKPPDVSIIDLGARRAARADIQLEDRSRLVRLMFGMGGREVDAQLSIAQGADPLWESAGLAAIASLSRVARKDGRAGRRP